MDLKQAAIFLSLVGIVMCMNLKVQQPEAGDKDRNVLYFEAHKQSLADQNANVKPNFAMLSNSACPNSTIYYCSNNLTCCPAPDKSFSCCPILQGVCCPDGRHCCPPNTYCDMFKQQCYMQNKHKIVTEDWTLVDHGFVQKSVSNEVSSADVVCPGGAVQCPDENTCCQMSTGDYACCPLPQATCCSDHTHCCPQGYTCNVTAATCTLGTKVLDWLTKTPAQPLKNIICKDNSHCPVGSFCCKLESGQDGCCPLVSVVCPGGESQCPDGTTCCRMKTGGYGCCPYQIATCCSDGLHCCPEGYRCDLSAKMCVRGNDIVSWLQKLKATPVNATVTCKDGTVCPDGNTCCELGSSQYGCCPLKEVSSADVVCPGGAVQCPDENTCCQLSTGDYACCPLPEATCCSDHSHCCPQGYTCNVTAATCTLGTKVLDWLTKSPAQPLKDICKDNSHCPVGSFCCKLESGQDGCCPLVSVVCPEGKSQCPDGNTCCRMKTGGYWCCPYQIAVCCSDHAHCCPQGYQCDVLTGTCNKGSEVLPWLARNPLRSAPKVV